MLTFIKIAHEYHTRGLFFCGIPTNEDLFKV